MAEPEVPEEVPEEAPEEVAVEAVEMDHPKHPNPTTSGTQGIFIPPDTPMNMKTMVVYLLGILSTRDATKRNRL